jgi:hypothetical protein
MNELIELIGVRKHLSEQYPFALSMISYASYEIGVQADRVRARAFDVAMEEVLNYLKTA